MSATDRNDCSLFSFLSMSCREREAFARNLQSRLSSLNNNNNENGVCKVDEKSWLGGCESSGTVSEQPRQSSETTQQFKDFLESPNSPEEEIAQNLHINADDSLNVLYPSLNGLSLNLGADLSGSHNTNIDEPSEDISSNHLECATDELRDVEHDSSTDLENVLSPEPTTLQINESTTLYKKGLQNGVERKVNGHAKEVITIISQASCDLCDGVPQPKSFEVTSRQKQNLLEVSLSDIYDDDVYDGEQPEPRVRRCSSLKTGKTPPGTPRKKKIVKFADALGLELANVRSFLDEIPKVPNYAFNDLKNMNTEESSLVNWSTVSCGSGLTSERILCAMFQQPGGLPNFLDLVREKNVNLENATVEDPVDLSVRGIVRVRNLDFNKSVYVRYTLDGWKTHSDLQTIYVDNSCDGFSDKFSFLLYGHTLRIGQSLEFALRYHCNGCQYWDNNYGANYCFQCLPASKHVDSLSIENYGNNWDPKFY